MNCEEGMKEKNEMSEERCTCVVREKKKERQGGTPRGTWVVGKKKRKEKRKKKWGVAFMYMVGKRGSGKKEEKKFEREKTKLILFVCSLCLMQSVEL